MNEEMMNRAKARLLIERARALLILRESVRCADAVSMCNQMGDVLQEMLTEVERLTARLRELASAEDHARRSRRVDSLVGPDGD